MFQLRASGTYPEIRYKQPTKYGYYQKILLLIRRRKLFASFLFFGMEYHCSKACRVCFSIILFVSSLLLLLLFHFCFLLSFLLLLLFLCCAVSRATDATACTILQATTTIKTTLNVFSFLSFILSMEPKRSRCRVCCFAQNPTGPFTILRPRHQEIGKL